MSEKRDIMVVPYDPRWREMFRQEAERIATVFGEQCLSVEHIGSTAIPGLMAKPIIDIMPVVRDIDALERFYPAMIALGYEPLGENGIPGRRYFRKRQQQVHIHHVHAYAPGNPEVARHRHFRDYLIAHPQAAHQYERLKLSLAEQFPHDGLSYSDGKSEFIRATLQEAFAWAEAQRKAHASD